MIIVGHNYPSNRIPQLEKVFVVLILILKLHPITLIV